MKVPCTLDDVKNRIVDNIASEKILNKMGFTMLSSEWIEHNGIRAEVHNYNLKL